MKIKLLQRQKKTVSDWMQQKNGWLKLVRDRTCRYRDAVIYWRDRVAQPNGTTLIVEYQTILELTPTGLIRKEESKRIGDYTIDGSDENLLNLEGVTFDSICPETKVRNYLYKTREENQIKEKIKKPIQLSLPITETELKLQEISLNSGDKTIYSSQEILKGTEEVYSLEWGIVKLPRAIIILLQNYNCSLSEWEWVLQISLVIKPQSLLELIDSIPYMRSSEFYPQFSEPVAIKELDKQQNIVTQSVAIK